MENWTILKLLNWLTERFTSKEISEPRLSAEHIISHALNLKRLDLYLQFERPLNKDELASIKALIKRRELREPIQYILGSQPFRNVDIKVTKDVLIPRPETEIVVQETLNLIPENSEISLLELGVGSGAILASLANERKKVSLTGVEINEKTLEIAKKNTEDYQERTTLLCGNLFEPINDQKYDIIISNPPYIPEDVWKELEPEVRDFEPKEALVGGKDGLDFYREILNYAPDYLNTGGYLILELGDDQAEEVKKIAQSVGKYTETMIKKDLSDRDRVFIGTFRHPRA